jgi:hypothetical protein
LFCLLASAPRNFRIGAIHAHFVDFRCAKSGQHDLDCKISGLLLENAITVGRVHVAFRAHRGTQHEGVLDVLVIIDEEMSALLRLT